MTKLNRNKTNERPKRPGPSIEVEVAVEEQSRGALHIHGAYIMADENILTEAIHEYVSRRIVLGAEAAYRSMEQFGGANENRAMAMAAYIAEDVVKDDKRQKGAWRDQR